MAVGAVNVYDQITSYSSIGDPDAPLLKPDLVAPGGSGRVGRIVTADATNNLLCRGTKKGCYCHPDGKSVQMPSR